MFVEVAGLGSADAEGVDFGVAEAEEVVEDHGVEGGAEASEFLWRCVEVAAFVGGADDEDAHVALCGSFDGGPVELVDVVPVEVDVVELVGFDCFDEDVGGAVGGEADEAHLALGLKFANHVEEAAGGHTGVDVIVGVDAVDREEIYVVEV